MRIKLLVFEVFSIREIASDVQKATFERDQQKATESKSPRVNTEICGKRFFAEIDLQLTAGGFVYPDLYSRRCVLSLDYLDNLLD